MSLAERMKILQEKEEQWKVKGKGASNDSTQFSVAGRMAKRGEKLISLWFVTKDYYVVCTNLSHCTKHVKLFTLHYQDLWKWNIGFQCAFCCSSCDAFSCWHICFLSGLVSPSREDVPIILSKKACSSTPVKPLEGISCCHFLWPLFKYSHATMIYCWGCCLYKWFSFMCGNISWAEISTRPDAEGDKRLDKLESFLDKLHNKGYLLKLLH